MQQWHASRRFDSSVAIACLARAHGSMALPVAPRVCGSVGVVRKDGRLFGGPRQMGFGWEQFFRIFKEQCKLEFADNKVVELKGGDLQLKKRGKWENIGLVQVELSAEQRSFLCDQVKADFETLKSLDYWVTGVDEPSGIPRLHCDLTGGFTTGVPVKGSCPLEHKFVFGGGVARYQEMARKHKKAAELNFKKMQRLSVPPVGQLLLVTQVSGSTRPRTLQQQLLLATAAGRGWVELKPGCPAAVPPSLSFERVWKACAKHKQKGQVLAIVSEFLKRAKMTSSSNYTKERIDVWTKRGSKLGVMKRDFSKVKTKAGAGKQRRWAASKATFRKVWPRLVAGRLRGEDA